MFARFSSLAVVASVLTLNVAVAADNLASINQIQGKVLVNQGAGFLALADGSVLNAGDRVMVGKDSAAVIAYANGCSVELNQAKVVTVAKVAPCKAGTTAAVSGSNFIIPAADMDVGVSPVGLGAALPLLLIGGGAAVVGGILVLSGDPTTPVTTP